VPITALYIDLKLSVAEPLLVYTHMHCGIFPCLLRAWRSFRKRTHANSPMGARRAVPH